MIFQNSICPRTRMSSIPPNLSLLGHIRLLSNCWKHHNFYPTYNTNLPSKLIDNNEYVAIELYGYSKLMENAAKNEPKNIQSNLLLLSSKTAQILAGAYM